MFIETLKFDWNFFAKKKSFLLLLLFFPGFGIFTAVAANFPFPETYKNAPYIITYVIGIMSLVSIFTVTLLTAQGLLRERDSRFDGILYATPIQKSEYLSSRFISIFLIASLTFGLYVIGLYIGHRLFREHPEEFTDTGFGVYGYSFIVLALPNILFCTGIICSIGVLTKNKIAIYISGLFIYFLYWGIAMFSNSPMMANASPVSNETMQLMAQIDPFGLSAFFEQTRYWTALQRNQEWIALKGIFLWNRLIFITIAVGFIGLAYSRFSLGIGKQKAGKSEKKPVTFLSVLYQPVQTKIKGIGYYCKTAFSLVRMDSKALFKSAPIWVMLLGWVFFLAMEIAGNIHGGIRLPERDATTALMVDDILKLFPVIGLLIVLFYGSEIFWRSHSCRFDVLEKTTPVPDEVVLLAKWIVLYLIPMLLIAAGSITGLLFQLFYHDAPIDWSLYTTLFYLIGLPLALSAAFIVCIQSVCPNRYVGLVISSLLLLLTNTSLGGMIGLTHPLWRFANAYQGNYSEMNGFDLYIEAFHIKMLFWFSVTLVLFILIGIRFKKLKKLHFGIVMIGLIMAIGTGTLIAKETRLPKKDERNNWKQEYETRYKKYETLEQPVITDVRTTIELAPETNSYTVSGCYTIQNKGTHAMDSVLVYTDKDLKWKPITIPGAKLLSEDKAYGHYWYRFDTPLQPGKSAHMNFRFRYQASAFNDVMRFNAMLRNGTFIRISNFFPVFGYRSDNEIDDPKERKKRLLPLSSLVKPLDQQTKNSDTFIHLDMTIATAPDQIAIGIGELKESWQKGDKQYFRYRTELPVPFRFAVASARYAVKKIQYRDVTLEVYYHPEHGKNIDHLIRNAKQTLDYCEQNFSRYPYKILRFAEISSFTKGFAGTAYPTSFFVNEGFGFRNKIDKNPEKDIINEMVSHELSHNWWGNATIHPEYQEGSKVLTETLAMYTELMLYKKMYGTKPIASRVAVHRDLYLSERSFATEEPLYRSHPDQSFLCYDKGMVVMYQLEKLLGEQQINKALRNFLQRYAYPKLPPTSTDLLQELYQVSTPDQHRKIDELFKMIITHEVVLKEVQYTKNTKGGYDLDLRLTAAKYNEDGNGNRELIAFDEPLEIAVINETGRTEIVTIQKEQFERCRLKLQHKPVTVILDPNGLLLELNVENNRKTLQ